MPAKENNATYTIDDFLRGKSAVTVAIYHTLHQNFKALLPGIEFIPAKTMVGIATPRKRVAYITQFGKNFLHVVFPFNQPYQDNLCFQKIANVPGDQQFNHHLRLFSPDDINDEVISFMKLAIEKGS